MSILIKADRVRIGTGPAVRIGTTGEGDRADIETVQRSDDATRALPENATPDTTLQELSALKHAYAELEHETGARERIAYENGLAEGRVAGEKRVAQDHAAQREALSSGIQSALDAFRAQLDSLERLAIDVTYAALERLLGDASQHADLVVQTARHHLNQVAAGSAIGVEVSQADFPSDAQLESAFAAFAGQLRAGFVARPQLPAGACLIRLTLGTLDASLDTQAARIRSALSEIHDA